MDINNENDNLDDLILAISETAKSAKQPDLLSAENYTDGMIHFIKHADTPLLIAINGEWGSGKTSVLYTIKDRLCDGGDKDFYAVWINSLQFALLDSNNLTSQSDFGHKTQLNQGSQVVARILQSIVNQIMVLKPDYARKSYVAKLIGSIATISTNLKSVSDIAGDPLFGIGKSTIGIIAKISNVVKSIFVNKIDNSSADSAALISQLSIEIQNLVDEVLDKHQMVHNMNIQQYVPFDPFKPSDWTDEKHSTCTRFAWAIFLIICNLFTVLGFAVYNIALAIFNVCNILITRTLFLFGDFLKNYCYHSLKMLGAALCDQKIPFENRRKGFIFFIDDLDRIEPTLALEIVECLASVFNFSRCIFILSLDKNTLINVVKQKLKDRGLENDNTKCILYLNRLIHMSIDMPKGAYEFSDLFKTYLKKILFFTENELNNKHLIASMDRVVCLTIGQNPRSVKQLINNLSFLNVMKDYTWGESNAFLKNRFDINKFIDTITKEMVFIMLCIKSVYPGIFAFIQSYPYFKEWSIFIGKEFNIDQIDSEKFFEEINNECEKDEWIHELQLVCESFKYNFDNVRGVLKIIDSDLNKYITDNKIAKSEKIIYMKIFTRVFVLFFNKVVQWDVKRAFEL